MSRRYTRYTAETITMNQRTLERTGPLKGLIKHSSHIRFLRITDLHQASTLTAANYNVAYAQNEHALMDTGLLCRFIS